MIAHSADPVFTQLCTIWISRYVNKNNIKLIITLINTINYKIFYIIISSFLNLVLALEVGEPCSRTGPHDFVPLNVYERNKSFGPII